MARLPAVKPVHANQLHKQRFEKQANFHGLVRKDGTTQQDTAASEPPNGSAGCFFVHFFLFGSALTCGEGRLPPAFSSACKQLHRFTIRCGILLMLLMSFPHPGSKCCAFFVVV